MATRNDSDDDAREALRAAMLDWREPLTAVVSLPNKLSVEPWYIDAWERSPDDSEQVFWLSCQGATVDTPDFRRRMEAAELFEDAAWADLFETRTALRVGLAVEFFVGVRGVDELRLHMATRHDLFSSSSYKKTRLLLEESVGDSVALPFVPVKVDHFGYQENFSELVNNIKHVIRNRGPDKIDWPLRFTQVRIDPSAQIANQEALECIQSLRAAGIHVTDLPVVNFELRGCDVADSAKALASMLDASPSAGTRLGTATAIERIVVDREMPAGLVPCVLSAAYESRSLRALEFDIEKLLDDGDESEEEAAEDPERKQLAWWIALVLFRRRTALSTIEIQARGLFMKDVERMQRVLAASNPLSVIFPEVNDTEEPRVAQTRRAVLYDPHDRKNAIRQQSWISETPMTLDVLGDSRDGFITVLLPGWGRAWIREEKATIMSKTTQAGDSTCTTTNHLIIRDVGEMNMEAVLRLLRIVGHNLKRLEIDDCDGVDDPLDAFCAQVLACCPNLEELEFSRMELTSFQYLHDAFRDGLCPALQKLTLSEIKLHDRDAVDHLLTRIATPRDRMAVQLRNCVQR